MSSGTSAVTNPVCPVAESAGLGFPRCRRAQRRRALRTHCQRPDRNQGRTARRHYLIADVQCNRPQWTGRQRGHGQAQTVPAPPAANALGWQPQTVNYDKNGGARGRFFVPSRKGRWLSAYPKTRTQEHMMTVGFPCRGHRSDSQCLAGASENKDRKHACQDLRQTIPDHLDVGSPHQTHAGFL